MSLLINLTPSEEAQLSAVAQQSGLEPEALAENMVREQLPKVDPLDEMRRKLREWQKQDNTPLMPTRSTSELFAEWAAEDAKMTDEEREAEERLWEDIQRGINETRAALGMRLL